ncbi:hypothetical protein ABFS82_14G052000 [Erythranthe guttata]|uniref:DUF538 domain-containing protein n=1 Tax=Erythranthe guttata TaxID=4155 RepID=A0A022QUV6_ERYGU|nr:PREDICTED: uncharacterized protein LOC105964271 [Erythranthe guttata]EYU31691.1 hypothetical protein MIMGU_mgv1a015006mg [Erythranthe guttata]|eukprot:XP_012844252.1 PREDICTED: uncharacterized protein LOC105964271 [Erythranthe guttata]
MASASSTRKVQHAATAIISLIILLTSTQTTLSDPTSDEVHELLTKYNLPKGILPKDIKSYALSNQDNSFTIELSSNPCYVKFKDQVVYYAKTIKGKLSYGKVTGVSGIQAKKFFIWVSVTGMEVDQKNDMVEFHVGAISQSLPAEDFEEIPSCKAKALLREESFSLLDALI